MISVISIFQLKTSYLSPTGTLYSFSFLKQTCQTSPIVMGKMLLFQKDQIVGRYQAKKTKIEKITIGLRTVHTL